MTREMERKREAWVTGLGIVSSLGEGHDVHHQALMARAGPGPRIPVPHIDASTHAPYTVHPLADIDIDRLIPSKADRKQMGIWQRLGVHTAGLALQDANVAGHDDILDRMDLVVAAGNGERDEGFDTRVLEQLTSLKSSEASVALNAALMSGLRPTLYLGELSNLLAGNIQIVHKVTGSSRTLKGEEISGLSAIEDATRRINAGQAEIVLVGGAHNADRNDLLLNYELGSSLWSHPYEPVWRRSNAGGGFVPGSAAAFLVIESSEHALARGAKPYARIADVACDRAQRGSTHDIYDSLRRLAEKLTGEALCGSVGLLSGASGAEPATSDERLFLNDWNNESGHQISARAYGSILGHTVEAHAPLGVALACLALDRREFFKPFEDDPVEQLELVAPEQILVTSVGHWRGEGLALLERITIEARPK